MMTADAILEIVNSVTAKNPAIPGWRFFAEITSGYSVTMRVAIDVPDRETGEMTTVYHNNAISFSGESQHMHSMIINQVVRFMRNVFVHEADEAIHVNGVRYRDPHEHDTRAVDIIRRA